MQPVLVDYRTKTALWLIVHETLRQHWQPHAGQLEFLQRTDRIKVLACGRRWGKTDACAVSILQSFAESTPTKHLILAPTLEQTKFLFERIVELIPLAFPASSMKIKRSPHPQLEVQVTPDGEVHRLKARSGHLGYTLRGDEATNIVVDEAAYVPESLITEVAMPMLATTRGQLTLISTPRGKNHFYKFFRFGQTGEHGVWSKAAPTVESPFVSADFLSTQKELLSERVFRVEYLAEFMDTSGKVFPTDAVERCVKPRLNADPAPPYSIGIDWARFSDYTAIAVLSGSRDDAKLVQLVRFNGLAWSDQVQRVSAILEQYPGAKVLCDATGVGDPVLEMLRARNPHLRIEGLVFSQPKKQELIDNLAWMFERGAIQLTPYPDLLRELEYFEATTSPSGNVRLAAASGYHDDLVVALALAAKQCQCAYSGVIATSHPRQFSHQLESETL